LREQGKCEETDDKDTDIGLLRVNNYAYTCSIAYVGTYIHAHMCATCVIIYCRSYIYMHVIFIPIKPT